LNLVAAQQLADRQIEAARASYTKVAEVAPGDSEALAGLVTLDLTAGRTKDAVGRIDAALKRVEPTGSFLMLAAETYAAAGDPVKAEDLLKRAIDAEPARLKAYNLLGGLYIRQHRLDDARDQFQRIAERNPKSTSANTMLAMLLEAQHRLPEAELQYQKVLAIDSRAAVAANNLAWLYVASGRNLDQALQLAQAAVQQLPDEPHANDTIGWIYYRKNMASAAIRHLESSVQKDSTDPATHYHLGMAYLLAGRMDKAKVELQRALAFKTEFDGAAEARKTLLTIGH
jgi:tetratricopeptide (TPR) repeat protein